VQGAGIRAGNGYQEVCRRTGRLRELHRGPAERQNGRDRQVGEQGHRALH